MNEKVPGRWTVDLVTELTHEDVDRAVAVALTPAPDPLHQLLARDDAALLERECVQQPEFRRRQPGALAVDVRLHVTRIDHQLLDLDPLAPVRRLGPNTAADGGADAGDERAHRERLDEVVVGAELERPDPVALGATTTSSSRS